MNKQQYRPKFEQIYSALVLLMVAFSFLLLVLFNRRNALLASVLIVLEINDSCVTILGPMQK